MKKLLNKNGFSLVELLAVVVVLSILITISVIAYSNIRKRVLDKDYDNLVTYLETKAVEFASNTNITTISVEDLIEEGYVKPDDSTDVYDPRDNITMNCNILTMKYIDGRFEAKLVTQNPNSDGICDDYTKTSLISICTDDDKGVCQDIEDKWYPDNITLKVKFGDEVLTDNNSTFSWISNTGGTGSIASSVTTNVSSSLQVTYKCDVIATIGSEIIPGSDTKVIKIDRNEPKITAKGSKYTIIRGYSKKVEDYFDVKYTSSGGTVSCNPTNTSSLSLGTHTVKCTVTGGNGKTASATTTIVVNPPLPAVPKLVARYENASGSVYDNDWTYKSIYFGLSVGRTNDVISYYQYKIGTSGSWKNPSDLSMSGNNGSFIYSADINDVIYVRACNITGCSGPTSGTSIKIDTDYPTITARNSTNSILVGTSGTVSSYFDINYSASGGSVVCSPSNTKTLAIGTHYVTCTVTGGNGLTAKESTMVEVNPLLPSIPSATLRYNNASGSIYSGTWTNNSIYFGLSAGNTGDTVSYYQYKVGASGSWLSLSNNYFTYSSNIDNSIYVRACNVTGCSASTSGLALKIDKNYPTISPKNSSYTITVGSSNTISDYFNVSYSISGGSVSCSPSNTSSLSVGTHTATCSATGGNGLISSASTTVTVNPDTPSAPSVVLRYNNASGSVYSGTWTSNSIYFGISAGSTSDRITYYQYKIGTYGSWSSLSSNNFTYSSNINNSVYVRSCNNYGCGDATGASVKIDKTNPSVTNVSFNTTNNVLTITATDTGGSGLSKVCISGSSASCSWNSSYDISSGTYTKTYYTPPNILTGKIYVFVKDNAGNVSSVKEYTIVKLPDSISVNKADSSNHYYSDGAKVTVCLNGAIGINNFTIDKQFYSTYSGISVSYQYINNAYCFVDTVNNTPRKTYVYYTAKYNGSSVKSVASDSSYISLYATFWNVTTASYYIGCDDFYEIDVWTPKPSAQVNGCNKNNRVWTYGKTYSYSFSGQYVDEYSTSDYIRDLDYSCYRFADQFDY